MKYSLKKGLIKGILPVIIFGIPFLINQFPTYADLTIGGLGIMLINYLKVKYKSN